MKNKLKKLTLGVLSAAVVTGATMTMTGCGDKNEDKLQVMNLSVNPGIEFIVDKDDKVVSVTADNEDGAYILSKFTEFTGMSAKDAALKFLELSEQYGFVVSGSVDNEKITISVSGQGAEDLYKDVKKAIQSKVSALGMQIADLVKVTEAELEDLIEECYLNYTESEIKDLSEERMLELLQKSREETKGLFTEDERLEYYKERAMEILNAKIETVSNYLESNQHLANIPLVQTAINSFNSLKVTVGDAYDRVMDTLDSALASFKTNRDEYIEQKKAYLEAVEAYKQALADTNATNVEQLKQTMEDLRATAKDTWEEVEGELTTAKNNLISGLRTGVNTLLSQLNHNIDLLVQNIEGLSATDIENEINQAIDTLKTTHTNNATNPWETTNNN